MPKNIAQIHLIGFPARKTNQINGPIGSEQTGLKKILLKTLLTDSLGLITFILHKHSMYTYIYVCVYIYMCVYIYIYIYVYIYIL